MIVQAHVINMIAAHSYVLTIIKLSVGGLGEEEGVLQFTMHDNL